MNIDELKPGTVVKGKRWTEPIEIKKIEIVGEYLHIVGSAIAIGVVIVVIVYAVRRWRQFGWK